MLVIISEYNLEYSRHLDMWNTIENLFDCKSYDDTNKLNIPN